MAHFRFFDLPLVEWKNPREGRSQGEDPDTGAYPHERVRAADDEVEDALHGRTENEKTFHQEARDKAEDVEYFPVKEKKHEA